VVVDNTDSIDSTSSRARILASAPDASLANWTVSAENTLWSAADVWISDVILLTGACNLAVDDCALSVGSTRIRIARILGFWRWNVALSLAEEERITGIAWRTVTDRIVVFDVAVGVNTTGARTRILTTLANAG